MGGNDLETGRFMYVGILPIDPPTDSTGRRSYKVGQDPIRSIRFKDRIPSV